MHCLYGLQRLGLGFELKGGTSLSKGLGIIHRFSEDIDIRIEPGAGVAIGRNHTKAQHLASREAFYDILAEQIVIDGVTAVERDRSSTMRGSSAAAFACATRPSANPSPA